MKKSTSTDVLRHSQAVRFFLFPVHFLVVCPLHENTDAKKGCRIGFSACRGFRVSVILPQVSVVFGLERPIPLWRKTELNSQNRRKRSKTTEIIQKRRKSLKIVENGQKRRNLAKTTENGENRSKSSKIGQKRRNLAKTTENGAKLSKSSKIGQNDTKLVKNGGI